MFIDLFVFYLYMYTGSVNEIIWWFYAGDPFGTAITTTMLEDEGIVHL
jgi:hypothetical protein